MKLSVEEIAQVCHETNRSFCESIGDLSQPYWKDAPEWQKDSAILGVKFHLANPTAGPSASHDEWLKVKRAEGWVYGVEKDVIKKEHPCMVEYGELPVHQKSKDFIFSEIVHQLGGI